MPWLFFLWVGECCWVGCKGVNGVSGNASRHSRASYYPLTCVPAWQIKELNQAKKMLGKKWFKEAAALKSADQDPAKTAAEKVRDKSFLQLPGKIKP